MLTLAIQGALDVIDHDEVSPVFLAICCFCKGRNRAACLLFKSGLDLSWASEIARICRGWVLTAVAVSATMASGT